MTSLAEHLAETYALPEGDEERASFRIEDNDGASWAMRKLAQAKRALLDIEEQARREEARIEAWCDEAEKAPTRDYQYFDALLREYHKRTLDGDSTLRTLVLPAGTLRARKAPDSWQAADVAAFLKWAKAQRPALVRTKEEPNIAEAKRVLEARGPGVVDPQTGEIVPGLVVEAGQIAFSVEVAE